MLYIPNEDVYNILSSIEGVEVSNGRPDIIAVFPSITFDIDDNAPEQYLDNSDVAYQDIIVNLEIWADDSDTSGELLSEVYEKMVSQNKFRMTFCDEIQDPSGKSHMVTRFNIRK